jgi:putative MATE family efflux protein
VTGESEEVKGAGEAKFANARTKGVETLLGDPKKAIIKLSIPMIIAMSVQTIYNLVDALWVSGLGPDALAAVGLFFPFFFILIAVATGIGVGAGAALSRRIGAQDKEGSDNVAIHSLLMMMGASLVMVAIFIPLTRTMFSAMGASGDVLEMTVQYSQIMFAAAPLLFFMNWATAIMRGEGNVTRPMWAMTVGSVVNMILDPIFIYTLDLGVAGAAWATVVAILVTVGPLAYWMFIKADTYVTMQRRDFNYSREIVNDIMKVGLPAAVMQLAMSISMLFLNLILVRVGGTDGVAVFTTGWRLVMIGILPLIGIAMAVTSVSAAAYGAREYGKLTVAFHYAVRLGFVIELFVAAAVFLLAPQIAAMFSMGEGGERIQDDIEAFLRIIPIFFPLTAFGMFSSALFQGTGKGLYALAVTVVRTVILVVMFAYLLSTVLGIGLTGVWWGMVIGNTGGSIIAFVWARHYIARLNGEGPSKEPPPVTV